MLMSLTMSASGLEALLSLRSACRASSPFEACRTSERSRPAWRSARSITFLMTAESSIIRARNSSSGVLVVWCLYRRLVGKLEAPGFKHKAFDPLHKSRSPFDFAQGRIFGDDKQDNCDNKRDDGVWGNFLMSSNQIVQ